MDPTSAVSWRATDSVEAVVGGHRYASVNSRSRSVLQRRDEQAQSGVHDAVGTQRLRPSGVGIFRVVENGPCHEAGPESSAKSSPGLPKEHGPALAGAVSGFRDSTRALSTEPCPAPGRAPSDCCESRGGLRKGVTRAPARDAAGSPKGTGAHPESHRAPDARARACSREDTARLPRWPGCPVERARSCSREGRGLPSSWSEPLPRLQPSESQSQLDEPRPVRRCPGPMQQTPGSARSGSRRETSPPLPARHPPRAMLERTRPVPRRSRGQRYLPWLVPYRLRAVRDVSRPAPRLSGWVHHQRCATRHRPPAERRRWRSVGLQGNGDDRQTGPSAEDDRSRLSIDGPVGVHGRQPRGHGRAHHVRIPRIVTAKIA